MKEYIVRIEHGADGAVTYFRTDDEIVRCKDCAIAQHDELFGQWYCNGKEVKPDGYCSDGERRTDDAQ